MASVRERVSKRGETTYQVVFRIGGKQTSETFLTAGKAEEFRDLVNLMTKMHGPGAGPVKARAELNTRGPTGLTVDDLAERFFDHKTGEVTPRTLSDYRRDYANWIKPTIGYRQASTIDELDVQGLVDAWKKRLDPKSVRDRHVIISSMYRWGSARTRRLVEHNPCTETELPPVRRKPVKGMTIPEWHAFYATARATSPAVADIALFLVATGWRWSEAAALTWAHVADYGDEMTATVGQVVRRRPGEVGAIVLDAKNATSLRGSRIGGLAATMLRRRQVGQPVEGFVFTSPSGRRWHQSNFLARHWGPIADTVFPGDRHPTPHWLRHTHALLLDRAGASTPQMARRLGHADIQTTVNVYGGLIGDVSPEILERVDAMLAPAAPAPELG